MILIPLLSATFLFSVASVAAFQAMPIWTTKSHGILLGASRRTKVLTLDEIDVCSLEKTTMKKSELDPPRSPLTSSVTVANAGALTVLAASQPAWATSSSVFSQGYLSPENFQPVCPASDGFYRILQQGTSAIVGPENFVDYGPLIAGGLLRVRLELCVVESFVYEAVIPFVKENGVSWILPLHETVETFLAGGIFALATTFILLGSTKIITVIFTYADFLLGVPARLLGGFIFDRAQGKPVTLDIGFGPFKTRILGPPEPKDGEPVSTFRLDKASPFSLLVLVSSGTIYAAGRIVGVSPDELL